MIYGKHTFKIFINVAFISIIKISRPWKIKKILLCLFCSTLIIVCQIDSCIDIVGVHIALNGSTREARYVWAGNRSIVGSQTNAQSTPPKVGQGLDDGGGDTPAREGDEAAEEEDEGGADAEAHLGDCLHGSGLLACEVLKQYIVGSHLSSAACDLVNHEIRTPVSCWNGSALGKNNMMTQKRKYFWKGYYDDWRWLTHHNAVWNAYVPKLLYKCVKLGNFATKLALHIISWQFVKYPCLIFIYTPFSWQLSSWQGHGNYLFFLWNIFTISQILYSFCASRKESRRMKLRFLNHSFHFLWRVLRVLPIEARHVKNSL